MAKLLSVGTAVPAHPYSQDEVAAVCEAKFAGALTPAKRAAMFANAGVASRRLVEPSAYYLASPSFDRRNADYLKHALPLSLEAVDAALSAAAMGHSEVSHIFSVTTTGLLTPSLEARLLQERPFSRRVKRTPLFGVGCAGGAVALARAYEYLKGHPDQAALVLSTELCSLSFLPEEGTATQLVAAALFADGAAAAVLRGAGPGRAEILAAESLVFDDSLDVMGWEFGEHGMRLVLSPRAPELVQAELGGAVDGFLRRQGLTRGDLSLFAVHPGSSRILDAAEAALDLPAKAVEKSRRFLAAHGNLSSASVLFILDEVLKDARPGQMGLLAALGPGFACETLLFRAL